MIQQIRLMNGLWQYLCAQSPRALIACLIGVVLLAACTEAEQDTVQQPGFEGGEAAQEGAVHAPAFDLPPSVFLSEASLAAEAQYWRESRVHGKKVAEQCPSLYESTPEARKCRADLFYQSEQYQRIRKAFPVNVTLETLANVPVEVIVPVNGIAEHNIDRVLVNLHGGAMIGGSRTTSQRESIPIAALGGIKVISVDYRMAPEHVFPAASEDVAAVYKELLKDYEPHNIGIYGCSAGGGLTAESMAWFQKEGLPLPGAIGMFCGAARPGGDTQTYGWLLQGVDIRQYEPPKEVKGYMDGADEESPLVWPGLSDAVMSAFPPSLLISSTRDVALSGVVATHGQLTRLGVEADLHVWDGLPHAFIYNTELPEAHEAYDVIVSFFNTHLGDNHEEAE